MNTGTPAAITSPAFGPSQHSHCCLLVSEVCQMCFLTHRSKQLRSGESRVNYALCVCADVHAFLRCQRTEFGRGNLFLFLTQGRMSSATLLSSLPHRYTALCASIVHAVFYLTFHLRQMRLRQGSARTQCRIFRNSPSACCHCPPLSQALLPEL